MVLDRSDGSQDESTIASTPARFVRLRVIGANGYNDQRVSLDEFGIFGESDPGTNLALNRPVVCSSEPEPENSCAKAVDGEVATDWSAIIANDFTIESPKWWWVDALYMAMPVYAALSRLETEGALQNKLGYSPVLYAKYDETKQQRGLYDTAQNLWYRDLRFLTLHSPNDQKIFWSRGNGWAFAALARVLEILPTSDPHYQDYLSTFQAMARCVTQYAGSGWLLAPKSGRPQPLWRTRKQWHSLLCLWSGMGNQPLAFGSRKIFTDHNQRMAVARQHSRAERPRRFAGLCSTRWT